MVSREVQLVALPSQEATRKQISTTSDTKNCVNVATNCFDFLRVDGWKSGYASVDLLLKHLSRKCRSEGSRQAYLNRLYLFCVNSRMNPDELIALPSTEIQRSVQGYVDSYNDGKHSIRYLNNILALLKAFFIANGFKGVRALEIEGYYMPARYRKTPECIPTKNEVYLMADSACSLRDRAIILTLFSSGIRNSTLRALLIKDVEEDLSKGASNMLLPVYPEMKLIDPCACKGNVPYFTFTCDEATEAIRLYLKERKEKYGSVLSHEPLFTSDYNQIDRNERRSKVISSRQLQFAVKLAAKRAGLVQWAFVRPHGLRKAFETVLHGELVDGGRLDPKVQEFFMGHILPGSEDTYFDKTKTEHLRVDYSKLCFARVLVVEHKFKVLQRAVARAFEGTGLNPDEVIAEYAKMRNVRADEAFVSK